MNDSEQNFAEPRRHRIGVALLVICLAALAIRLLAIGALGAWNHPNPMEHRRIAMSLEAGQGFQFTDWSLRQYTSVQSPPYPMLLAGAFKLFGPDAPAAYAAMLILNAFVGAATCAILFAAIRAVGGSRCTALTAASLLAVWPTQIYAATAAQAITIITACTVAIVWLFYRSVATRNLGPWIGYGVIGCLAALTEPVLLPFMALSGLLILGWPGLPSAIRLRNAAVLLGIALLVLAPWTIRNIQVHGKFVPVKSTFWVNMWKANNPHASGTDRPVLTEEQRRAVVDAGSTAVARDAALDNIRQYDLLTPGQQAELTGKPEVEREAIFGRYAKEYIRENPAGYARLCAIRLWKTLWVEADSPKSHGTMQYALYWAPRTILLAVTPIGLWFAIRHRWHLAIPGLIVGLALLTHTLTIAAARFAFPYEPFQLALMALLLVTILGRRDGRAEGANR